ncbi:MAG: preprotein translocase subunit SecE [Magnetococcales bacterium]|nr:preprotein translocase subunit SecE [Magnetococcales bacterium]
MGRIAQLRTYITEVRAEVGKVVWPTRKDTMNTTIIVLGMVILVSLFMWVVDSILALIVQLIVS